MDDTPDTQPLAGLIFLKWLVTGLTATMLVGLVVLIVLFVTRFPDRATVPLPATLRLPAGVEAIAFTRGPDWLGVVTADDRILILDAATQELRQTIVIERGDSAR
ncbi:DUF6476 family protein [Profundibacterium mesophilum]|uniref:Uncharacterized protein n=1 Tax=Profundibacterium mesophilum KAUST100406-0324 TaxID=1037889 RepID=A0A921NNH1_9RHOB|nr:DUF6476 family protein [Profundibacterium mesophilum]KAF0674946.1 hypothetical protein PMES_02655 [Profundibacterium mesophilum KAUST100406-0324]